MLREERGSRFPNRERRTTTTIRVWPSGTRTSLRFIDSIRPGTPESRDD